MKKEDEKKPITWEIADPKPPIVQSGHMENRKVNQLCKPEDKTHRAGISCPVVHLQLAVGAHLSEALAAEHGTVGLGLEGNLSLAAATGAGSGEELTGSAGSVLASVTASLAALGLVLEAALSVEFLLTGGENELVAALFAN